MPDVTLNRERVCSFGVPAVYPKGLQIPRTSFPDKIHEVDFFSKLYNLMQF